MNEEEGEEGPVSADELSPVPTGIKQEFTNIVTLDDDDEVDSGMNTCILIHYCV
jgi:hypothetical protein